MEDNCVEIWGGLLLGECVVVWGSRMAKLTAASPTSQAGLWHCCQTWGHWLKPRAELRGWLKGFRAGQWAGPGDAKGPSYGLNLLFFFIAVFISQGPCIYHACVLRLFPLVYCSYYFWFYGRPGKWLSWWPDIFNRLWALQWALSVMGWDVQNWVLEPPKSPSKDIATGFLLFLFIFFIWPLSEPQVTEKMLLA